MSNTYFHFKQFTIHQDHCAMKVTTDACLFGASLPHGEGEINVLDIGTGTGLLALMYAQKNSNAIIDAIEIDKDAAMQAKENVENSLWNDRINIIHADARYYSFKKKYDLIISNPPFYENELKSSDDLKNIAHHAAELSFHEVSGIINKNLSTDGEFFLLVPNKRMAEIGLIFQRHYLEVTHTTLVRQSVNHDIFRVFLKGKKQGNTANTYSNDEITIWNETRQYTPRFKQLLKDYYLNL